MPWAWGLAWQVTRGEGSRQTACLLAGVLALQILPGHFQMAFVTEVGVLILALAGGGGRRFRGSIAVGLAVVGMIPLAAMQLWPTFQLARLSDSRRDFEYLSGFAATPIHLISYVAPGLFHRSPLWRPVAWDPFHTSPEEWSGSVGLAPLFLALAAIRRGWRGDAVIRALAVVAGATLILSLGPYLPGFAWLIRIPGFSFFRAPARWGLATSLALALLAGRGFDTWRSWPNPGRSAHRFAVGAGLWRVLVVVGGFEMALASTRGAGWPVISSGFDRAMKLLPWAGEPRTRSFRVVMAESYRAHNDPRTLSAMARLTGKPPDVPGPSLANDRLAIYRLELAGSAGLVVAILAASGLAARRPRAFAAALLAITAADALLLARFRPFDLGPSRPLVEQSPGPRAIGPRAARGPHARPGAESVSGRRNRVGGILPDARPPLARRPPGPRTRSRV